MHRRGRSRGGARSSEKTRGKDDGDNRGHWGGNGLEFDHAFSGDNGFVANLANPAKQITPQALPPTMGEIKELEHDPEKSALGLDPTADADFPIKILLQQHSQGAVCTGRRKRPRDGNGCGG
ncbi:MAG: hypothetical protein WBB34_12015 [Xanthobacteraceae bacterium]